MSEVFLHQRGTPASHLMHTLTNVTYGTPGTERNFLIDTLLVRIHFIIAMIRWTGLAP